MHKFALAAVSAALLVSAGAASAQDYRIPFGDLDLGSLEGAAAFDARINAVASRACRFGAPMPDAGCRARFRVEVMRQLPAARRDDYARARGGRVLAMVPILYG
ncbi:UrcA family protein [Brevundimonas sp.]|uniref:UrcA family protein n=1 Tax=Brevundimonas sp. TaxID=1871086 RepID=UPI003D0E2493